MKPKLLQGRSQGSVYLARTQATAEDIAARLGVSRQLAGFWKTGRRTPQPEYRVGLRAAFGIDPKLWDLPAELTEPKPKKPAAGRRAGPPDDPAEEEDLTFRARAARLTHQVQELLDGLNASAPPLERAKVMSSAAATLSLLGKMTGETQDVSEDRILRMPAWRRVQDALVDALRPWPEAMKAAGEAISKLGGEV